MGLVFTAVPENGSSSTDSAKLQTEAELTPPCLQDPVAMSQAPSEPRLLNAPPQLFRMPPPALDPAEIRCIRQSSTKEAGPVGDCMGIAQGIGFCVWGEAWGAS